jgi:hypothetical protein
MNLVKLKLVPDENVVRCSIEFCDEPPAADEIVAPVPASIPQLKTPAKDTAVVPSSAERMEAVLGKGLEALSVAWSGTHVWWMKKSSASQVLLAQGAQKGQALLAQGATTVLAKKKPLGDLTATVANAGRVRAQSVAKKVKSGLNEAYTTGADTLSVMRSDVEAVRAGAGAMAESVKSKASWTVAVMDEVVTEEMRGFSRRFQAAA